MFSLWLYAKQSINPRKCIGSLSSEKSTKPIVLTAENITLKRLTFKQFRNCSMRLHEYIENVLLYDTKATPT